MLQYQLTEFGCNLSKKKKKKCKPKVICNQPFGEKVAIKEGQKVPIPTDC